MATVYLADDLKHHRPVAIKVLNPETASTIGSGRFDREIATVARLQHPHILPLFDSGVADGRPYFVMAFADGESLRDRLRRERRLPVEETVRIAREVADALGFAHEKGVVHRDIKPENVLLLGGHAVVTDFGIAHVVHATKPGEATQSGTVIGTPAYMSPEQAMGERVDGRSDLYSLGCVLYEMLAGEPPFTAKSATALLMLHANQPAPTLAQYRSGIPWPVAEAVGRLLSKRPAQRFATAGELISALATPPSPLFASAPQAISSETPHNLPAQATSFVGRERVVSECIRLLTQTRLLTLTGTGGSGKTRVALRIAEQVLDETPDGVWFVGLGSVADAERVAPALAAALGVRGDPVRSVTETLAAHLREKRALLLLDNLEHLLEASTRLIAALLRDCPNLRVLATSREPTQVQGELVLAITPLGVPGPGERPDAAAVAESEAGRLFVERASHARRGFALTDANAPFIADICRRLDGIPLAIELAAARARVLTVEEIQARLEDRFRLLAGSGPAVMPRHRTLRATLEWSYDHLAESEQQLFRALSTFVGGWTLEAAAAVGRGFGDEFGVLDLLTRLVDKSLVVVEEPSGGGSRYRYLETIRQYGDEKRHEAGEDAALQTLHLDYFVSLAAAAESEMRGPSQSAWLGRLDRDQENLLAALAMCARDPGGAHKALRLAGSLWPFWANRGHLRGGLRATREALVLAHNEPPTLALGFSLNGAAALSYLLGEAQEAKQFYEQAIATFIALGETRRCATPYNGLGLVAHATGEYSTARAHFENALGIWREAGDTHGVVTALQNLGMIAVSAGEYAAACAASEESVALARTVGDDASVANGLINLSAALIRAGRSGNACAPLLESLKLVRRLGLKYYGVGGLEESAGLAAAAGDFVAAAQILGASEAQGEATGVKSTAPGEIAAKTLLVSRIREALGEEAYVSANAEGRARSFESAMEHAIGWLDGMLRSGGST